MENAWFFKYFKDGIAESKKLTILHFVGLRLNAASYDFLGTGIRESTHLKSLII